MSTFLYNAGYINPTQNATIASSASLSSEINTGGMALCGVFIPATFTGTTITFQAASASGGTYGDVYNGSGQVSYTVAAGRYIAIDPKDFQGIQFLKIKSGSTEAGARTLICSLKGL